MARAFAHFFDAQPADDTPYALQGVERELPFDNEEYTSFSSLAADLESYYGPDPAYSDTVSGRTLAGVLEQSESVIDTVVMEKDTVVDRQLRDVEGAREQLHAADDELFATVQQDGNKPYRYDPFLLIDDHDSYLSYTAIIVGAENYLGCKERKLVLPSTMLAYSGTVDTELDPSTFVEDVPTIEQQETGIPYSKYETTMDRLARDAAHTQQLITAADAYQLLHPDCDTGTLYIEPPATMLEQQAQEIVDAVRQLGDTGDSFSEDVVTMKVENNDILLIDMLDTDADEIADDLDQEPRHKYLEEHPTTPLRHVIPGQFNGDTRGMPLSHPENEPYHDLIEQVAAQLEQDADPYPQINAWVQSVSWDSTSTTEPDHVDRMYQ